jgi:hypothetical protein
VEFAIIRGIFLLTTGSVLNRPEATVATYELYLLVTSFRVLPAETIGSRAVSDKVL